MQGCWKFLGGGIVKHHCRLYWFIESGCYLKVSSVSHFLSNPHAHRVDPTHEYSHLCHQTSCVNHEHIIRESHKDNMNRRKCKKAKQCLCDGNRTPCLFRRVRESSASTGRVADETEKS